jgi:hypothetical protein
MVNYIIAIIIGVLSSIVASLIFLLFLSSVKPKIIISEQIAKSKSSKGELVYKIKVINKTRRPIMDIRASLHIVTLTVIPGGSLRETKEILLKRSEIMGLEKFDKKDKEGNYAFNFLTYEDIENIWDDTHSYLRFRIYAIDSLSRFGKVFIKDYYTKRNVIKGGEFEAGESLKVL